MSCRWLTCRSDPDRLQNQLLLENPGAGWLAVLPPPLACRSPCARKLQCRISSYSAADLAQDQLMSSAMGKGL